MIDPQGQANKWIKTMEKNNELMVVRQNQKDFLRKLEIAIPQGVPVILENVLESLDPSLEPILLKQVFKKGGTYFLKIGENVREYNHKFRFYITSKLSNPH